MSVHSLSNTRRKEEALKLSPHPLGMIVRVSCSLHVFLPSEARRHGSDRRSCCPVQPIAWSDRRGGKSLLGGGKCDADIAMSNRELNLGLQFQNRVQTTRILQLKKKKRICHFLVLSLSPSPDPTHVVGQCPEPGAAAGRHWGVSGHFSCSPEEPGNLRMGSRWGRSCWG